MAGLLGQVFSAGNVAKRKLTDLLGNPVLSAQQIIGNLNDRARVLNEMTAAAAKEGTMYGPQSQQLAGLLAEAYNPVGMFIGPSSPMFNRDMALKASQMAKKGSSPQEIWQATGTVKGPDGQWRQEISDELSKFNTASQIQANKSLLEQQIGSQKQLLSETKQRTKEAKDLFPKELTIATKELKGKVKEAEQSVNDYYGYSADPRIQGNYANIAVEHPTLYSAYPELKDIIVYQGRKSGDEGMRGTLEGRLMDITQKGLLDNPRSTAIHELQHAIQEKEGFGVGGNMRDFAVMKQQAMNQIKSINAQLDEFAKKLDDKSISDAERAIIRKQYDDAMEEKLRLVPTAQIDPYEAYGHLMGEAEARLTQRRIDLTPEERRRFFPFEYTGESGYGLDVRPERMIYMTPDGTIIQRGLLGP